VELVDRTMIELSLQNPAFAPVIRTAVLGQPDAVPAGGVLRGRQGRAGAQADDLSKWMGDLGMPGLRWYACLTMPSQ
jgi:hypothetical protein